MPVLQRSGVPEQKPASPRFEQVRGKRMTKSMAGHPFFDTSLLHSSLDRAIQICLMQVMTPPQTTIGVSGQIR